MFTSSTMMTRPRTGLFYTHVMSSIEMTGKKMYRKGVVFMTVASLLLISGGLLTWLGFTNVFGGTVSMTGPLLLALAVLLFLCSVRQFLVAKKMRQADVRLQISNNTVAAMVVERDYDVGTVTIVVDTASQGRIGFRRRSADNAPPPNYQEATSDFYTDSVVCMDTIPDGPPPPYGPPPYDEVVATDSSLCDTLEHEERSEAVVPEYETEYTVNDPKDDQCSTNTETEEQETSNGHYQDLPTVTI